MKTSVERIDDTSVKLSVTVEAERVSEAIEAAAQRLAADVKVPGFRPGRVPKRVLESRLGKDTIAHEAARDALPRFFSEAASAEELAAVGPPEFDLQTFEDGQEGVFTATVEVRPDIEVPAYDDLQVPHPEWELTEDEVDEQLDQLRERFATVETVQRPAQVGDHVLVSISGTKDGEPVAEVAADDTLYEVGDADETDSELDRQLAGASPGAILKFTDTLGPDYGERAGQEVQLTAIVKEVKARRLPDLDDAFAADASEFDTVEELRAELRRVLAEQKLEHARQELRGKVVEAVVERVEVPLPPSMVQEELRYRLDRVAAQAEHYGMSTEQLLAASGVNTEELLAQFEREAEQAVKAQLVLDVIGREAGIDLDQNDLQVEVMRQAQRLGKDPQELANLMTQREHIGALVTDAFRRKTIDHLLDRVQVLGGPPETPAPSDDEEEAEGEVAAAVAVEPDDTGDVAEDDQGA